MPPSLSVFWRDPALPFIEARQVADGRKLCYARHSHATFSIGAITGGTSTYINRDVQHQVHAGSVVLMNPGDVHACNPIDDQPWSYLMLYVDCAWLAGLQQQLGFSQTPEFKRLDSIMSEDGQLYSGLLNLYQSLTSDLSLPGKQQAAERFFRLMLELLDSPAEASAQVHGQLEQAASFIRRHCGDALKIEDICSAAGLSPSYLSRAFKQHYGMTPHAYLLNQRIQLARNLLREGQPLADVALQTGFADQAHFQRAFKQLLAATPGHYRG
ncbi:helix-turn-helix transcriptional regulator [Pseudomonas sp. 5P_3.1_Bac2]|uniref:helix-turn-helix transcriptional regulator n=1 Tax=Pseudomonas sp. 5P_3.1_Bac2 TaxID=2971617 RepID=UPI0021C5F60F|nr:AraC family transcriptional regulator [Pseudomonas sp. 5P_3.1_Bac2]MCU1716052.1 AraC family transcriptional regulator [Pseudomonas sp. 5P_3.1_Bac2]